MTHQNFKLMSTKNLSIIIPVYNESKCIAKTINTLQTVLLKSDIEHEIIIVDDGSTDKSRAIIEEMNRIILLRHPSNKGYGASIKTGLSRSKYDNICITDADGTYPLEKIPFLAEKMNDHDMVVGARIGNDVNYSWLRSIPKFFLRHYVNFITSSSIPDINSGLRIFDKGKAKQFHKLYPDGFSLTTTITIAFITSGYSILYEPISYKKRIGKSKIQPIRDTIRFFQLITRLGMYFAPLKVLFPFILGLGTMFCLSLGYDIFLLHNITDKTILLLLFCLNTIFFALIADMIHKRISPNF